MRTVDLELINQVAEDLEVLAEVSVPDASDRNLKRSSVELRRLSIDAGSGLLPKAWQMLVPDRKGPTFSWLQLPADRLRHHEFAWAGTASTNLGTGYGVWINPTTNDPRPAHENVTGSLTSFLDANVLFDAGTAFRRRDIIDFLANKYGGVHLDKRRSPDQLTLLNTVETTSIFGKSILSLAMIEAAQTLIEAEDIAMLRAEMRNRQG